ncbi:cupin domain-containing protein [Neoroseomonas soli]|uniref:Cupin domain-containing protein n=1 Tax=Neoroseomonas soli TaxID=1081025 RepID=A0A9X9WZV7_9PROT|nr:cupin domain-containing protein [Neoroseomonas soli]MBR0672686.1 cupin domain-containing protein [Neoroseomonas soli]
MSRHVFPAALAATLPKEAGRASARIFTHGSFEARWYAPHGLDPQAPHNRDEAYVVVRGRGTFFCNGVREPFAPGDLLWVPAGAEHRFEDFSPDLAVWVIFYGPEGGESTRTA